MVKTDFSKDYYGDLELQPNADINEVKKQFRKLALKYHPDRNPGRESEVNSRFQTIQAAHEILSNPDTKARYDAQRSRTSFYPTASGVRGNPYSNLSSQFPRPPRRGDPPPMPPRPTPSASSRYSNFNVPPSAKTAREDPKKHYEAWESMKGKTGGSKRAPPRPPPAAPTARTQSQKQKAEASFGNRKSGYMPQSPLGDDPPASSSHYFSRNRPPTMEPETPTKPRRASHMEPGTAFRESFADERQSTPYRSHAGEKLNPFDGVTNLNRAKSTRESARPDAQETTNPPRRHKSSEDMSPSQNGAPFGTGAGRTFAARMDERAGGLGGSHGPAGKSAQDPFAWNDAADQDQGELFAEHWAKAKELPRRRKRKYFADDHEASNPKKPAPSTTKPEHTTYAPDPFFNPTPIPSASILFNRGYQGQGNFARGWARAEPAASRASSQRRHTDAGFLNADESTNTIEDANLKILQQLLEREPKLSAALDRAAHSIHQQNIKRADTNTATSFQFPRNHPAYDSSAPNGSFATKSTERINTSFVEEDHAGTDYQFNAGGPYFGNDAGGIPTPRRTQSGSRLRRRATGQDPRHARPAQSAETLSPGRDDTTTGAFNIDDWQEKLSTLNFAPSAAEAKNSASPTKNGRLPRKPRVRPTVGSAGLVDEDDFTSGEERGGPSMGGERVESPGAMDIDPPLAPSNGARNINVEPSRPDWRAGDINAGMAEPPARPPKHPIPAFNTSNAAGSEDTDYLRGNLADLRNVAPLAPSGTGFESLRDLNNSLPYESKASSRIHLSPSSTEKKKVAPKINFPRTPSAPRPPPTLVVPSLTPTAGAWETYVNAFSNYLHEWHIFNARFVDHFQARRGQVETQRRNGGFTWLNSRSDAGMDEYMHWIEQDQEVRARWADACDDHVKRMAEFKAYRKAYLDKLS